MAIGGTWNDDGGPREIPQVPWDPSLVLCVHSTWVQRMSQGGVSRVRCLLFSSFCTEKCLIWEWKIPQTARAQGFCSNTYFSRGVISTSTAVYQPPWF